MLNVADHRQGLVVHAQQIKRVFRQVPVFGHDHRNGLPHMPHPVHGQGPVLHGLFDADDEGLGPGLYVRARQDCPHPRERQRRLRVNRQEAGVGMGRAQNRCVQRSGAGAQVIGVGAASIEQGIVFQSLQALADPCLPGRARQRGF